MTTLENFFVNFSIYYHLYKCLQGPILSPMPRLPLPLREHCVFPLRSSFSMSILAPRHFIELLMYEVETLHVILGSTQHGFIEKSLERFASERILCVFRGFQYAPSFVRDSSVLSVRHICLKDHSRECPYVPTSTAISQSTKLWEVACSSFDSREQTLGPECCSFEVDQDYL